MFSTPPVVSACTHSLIEPLNFCGETLKPVKPVLIFEPEVVDFPPNFRVGNLNAGAF